MSTKSSTAMLTVCLCTIAFFLFSFAPTKAAPEINATTENDLFVNEEEYIDLSAFDKTMFGYPDRQTTGVLVAEYNQQKSLQNPEELGTYLEGDILIPATRNFDERNGILKQSSHWPGAVVPYEIKGSFTARDLSVINYAFEQYHSRTCIRFRKRTYERDYISIVSGKSGCWSSVGRLGGRQEVNLQTPSCLMTYGTAIHELMHALGFFHEQNRHERDYYVRVLSENIKPQAMVNFHKSSSKESYAYGVPYDYASVMHYSPTSFSKNGKPTIMALKKSKEAAMMGQRRGFSAGDVAKVNAMYRCK